MKVDRRSSDVGEDALQTVHGDAIVAGRGSTDDVLVKAILEFLGVAEVECERILVRPEAYSSEGATYWTLR